MFFAVKIGIVIILKKEEKVNYHIPTANAVKYHRSYLPGLIISTCQLSPEISRSCRQSTAVRYKRAVSTSSSPQSYTGRPGNCAHNIDASVRCNCKHNEMGFVADHGKLGIEQLTHQGYTLNQFIVLKKYNYFINIPIFGTFYNVV